MALRLNLKPPLKKRRTLAGMEVPGPIPSITRSEEFWLEDGTIVLQAETTQFLVHKSVLSRHSVVFSDMFSISKSEDTHDEPFIEGKPLVQIFDTAEDIDHLLRLLYDRDCDPRRKIRFKVIEVMLRLGNKYDIHQLVAEATARLHIEFPTNLHHWDLRFPSVQKYTFKGIKEQNSLLFDVVNLALQHEILSILPVAYFSCLADIDAVLAGEERDDGSRAMLSSRAKQACVSGRDKILQDIPHNTLRWMDPGECSEDCEQRAVCSRTLANFAVHMWKLGIDAGAAFVQREQVALDLNLRGTTLDDLCSICQEGSTWIHSTGRAKMWVKLPSYFGLGSWRELEMIDPRKFVDG